MGTVKDVSESAIKAYLGGRCDVRLLTTVEYIPRYDKAMDQITWNVTRPAKILQDRSNMRVICVMKSGERKEFTSLGLALDEVKTDIKRST